MPCQQQRNSTSSGRLTEIPRLELFCERHICGLVDASAILGGLSNARSNVLCWCEVQSG